MRFITDTDEVQRHYPSVLRKKQTIQDRFLQCFESALQNKTGNTSRRLPLAAHQAP
jgi:hypothetical protein